MNRTYVIVWRSLDSERYGRGKKLMTREEAETLAGELNREYPAFIHEAVDLEAANAPDTQPAAAPQSPVLEVL